MQKSMIRVVLVVALMLAGNVMQAHAATLPAPTPTLPPVSCK